MRHVFTNNTTIAKLWATQAQNHARNKQHNFYFTGNTIYSYGEHFPIASIETRFERNFVMVNNRTYSMTTNRHQWCVRWAIHHHLAEWPRLELPLSGERFDFDNWVAQQKAGIQQFIQDLNNARKIHTPTRMAFVNVIERLNDATYYLCNQTDAYRLDDFIRPVELEYLLTKVEERKTYRESKQKLKQAFGCSDYVARKILQQACRKAA